MIPRFLNYSYSIKGIENDEKIIIDLSERKKKDTVYSPAIFNEIYVYAKNLEIHKRKAIEDQSYANMWAYTLLLLTDFIRGADLILQTPNIDIKDLFVKSFDDLQSTNLTFTESNLIINQLYLHFRNKRASKNKQFLTFIQIENNEALLKICEKFPKVQYQNRDLPKLKDILKLDEIINDYFKTYEVESTFRYLPIMLWWLITNIIPQRPSEFLLLKKDCLFTSNVDGTNKYFIIINRRKNDNREEPLEIDEVTYNIIKNIINEITIRFNNDSPYLFTTDFYYHNQIRKHKRKNQIKGLTEGIFILF